MNHAIIVLNLALLCWLCGGCGNDRVIDSNMVAWEKGGEHTLTSHTVDAKGLAEQYVHKHGLDCGDVVRIVRTPEAGYTYLVYFRPAGSERALRVTLYTRNVTPA